MQSAPILAIFQQLGFQELIVIGLIALLIFGRRLPEVGRSLGRGIVEFKKGLRETEDDIRKGDDDARDKQARTKDSKPDRETEVDADKKRATFLSGLDH